MNMSGNWAVGVVDTDMNFRVRNSRWCATTFAWDGTYGFTKDAAIDVTTNGVTIEGWDDSLNTGGDTRNSNEGGYGSA